MNADEKAVAECFAFTEEQRNGDQFGLMIRGIEQCALKLAARIRAEASGEVAAALARAERAEARMDALRGWLVDHECKNDRCPFCRTLDLIAELEKP